ncbi:MAG TPA: DEAD/DEAH box helicase [Chloroflexota bacterium]|jgi:ATP-dependent RNA helicase DeaD|nr:DEAD/DEAH box helicase [Chloroflexota bacterium]
MNTTTNVFAGLRPEVRTVLAAMGIAEPTPIQAQAIPAMLDGRDVIGQARTGSGKTLAFVLPIVERCDPRARGVQALVVVPTRELAVQVGDVVARLAPARGLRHLLLYGGRSLLPEQRALRAGAQIVVGTPGRLLDHSRQGNLSLRDLRILVLDEGDEMLDRGFAPDVERILSLTPAGRQTALFSATVPEWVMNTAAKHLREPAHARVDRDVDTPPEIEHVVYEIDPAAKLAALRALLDARGAAPMLVFGRTKHGVKKLAKQLAALGYPAEALQGNMSQNARERVMASFRSGELPILLATNVAARGIDVGGIERVINYELPESAELFTHRSGRTGRMGQQGEVITFVTPEDEPKWRQMERGLGRRLPRRAWGGHAGGGSAAAPPAQRPAPAGGPTRLARGDEGRRAAPAARERGMARPPAHGPALPRESGRPRPLAAAGPTRREAAGPTRREARRAVIGDVPRGDRPAQLDRFFERQTSFSPRPEAPGGRRPWRRRPQRGGRRGGDAAAARPSGAPSSPGSGRGSGSASA